MTALTLALALAFASAGPQPPPRRAPLSQVLRGEALERYEQARQDFKEQRFQQALAGFLRAFALSKEPRLRWNAAACLRKLERNAEALRTLDAYLAEASTELTAEELDETRRSQEALRALVATVVVTVTPPDATVSIDGAPLESASGEVLFYEPGPHVLLAEKAGFEAQLRRETLRAGQRLEWAPVLREVPAPARGLEPTPPPAVVRSGAPRPTWAPWLVAGLGVAAAVTGGVLFAVAGAEYEALRGECAPSCPPARWAPARDAEVAGVTLLAVGGALALGGLGWGLAWAFDGGEARVALTPTHVSLEVRF